MNENVGLIENDNLFYIPQLEKQENVLIALKISKVKGFTQKEKNVTKVTNK